MTACIVGWAHTPFGRLEGETVESLIVRVAEEALADAGVAPPMSTRSCSGISTPGFSAQDFTASLVLQASPDLRFKRASRVENACATGSAAVHQGLKVDRRRERAHRARGRRRADDDDARGGDRAQPAQGLLCARGGRYRRRLRRDLRPDRGGSISSATATSPTRSRASPPRITGMASAIPTRRCARTSATSSAAARAKKIRSSPGRSSAPIARWSPTVRPPSCSPTATPRSTLGKAVAFRAAAHVQDFLPMSKRDILKFEGCALAWQRALASAGLTLPTFRLSRPTTASPSPS